MALNDVYQSASPKRKRTQVNSNDAGSKRGNQRPRYGWLCNGVVDAPDLRLIVTILIAMKQRSDLSLPERVTAILIAFVS